MVQMTDASRSAEAAPFLRSRWIVPVVAAIFALKAAALISFSAYEVKFDALNSDFAIFYQCWSLLVHGNLNPFSTMVAQPFWKDHFATAMWPVGLFGLISHSQMVLKLIQDFASAGADYVGALWTLAILRRTGVRTVVAAVLLASAIVSLLMNPWTYYTDAFDFHFYTISELFMVASLYSFYIGRRTIGLLCALGVCTGGDVNATYVAGLGASIVLGNRRYWKDGLAVMVGAVAIVVGMHAAGAGTGSGLSRGYGYLIASGQGSGIGVLGIGQGIISHPFTVLGTLWDNRIRIYDNLGPNGWIGYFCPWVIGPWTVLLLENMLYHGLGGIGASRFSLPGFQFGVGYAALPPAATWVIVWVGRRLRNEIAMYALAGLVALNALGWGLVWLPDLKTTFIRIPLSLSREVYRIGKETPDAIQLSASQGIVGGISARPYVGQFFGIFTYVVYTHHIRFVITPYSGTEVATVEESADAIAEFLDSKHTHVIRASNLLWMFDYDAGGRTRLRLGEPHPNLPAVAFASDVGSRTLRVNSVTTSLSVGADNPTGGYLLKQAYFRRPPGPYTVALNIRAKTPVLVEVRDASKDLPILSQRFSSPTLRRLEIPVSLAYEGGEQLYDGFWPFYSPSWKSSPYDQMEVRVWAPAHTEAEIRTVGITPMYVELR
jgi:hypothetical protein